MITWVELKPQMLSLKQLTIEEHVSSVYCDISLTRRPVIHLNIFRFPNPKILFKCGLIAAVEPNKKR